jgi:phage terminase large subunit-like protein
MFDDAADDWLFKARDAQLPPADLDWCWLFLGGRGTGKSHSMSATAQCACSCWAASPRNRQKIVSDPNFDARAHYCGLPGGLGMGTVRGNVGKITVTRPRAVKI